MISLIPIASSSLANSTAIVAGGKVVIVDAGVTRKHMIDHLSGLGILTADHPAPDFLLVSHAHEDHSKYAHQWTRYAAPIYTTAGTRSQIKACLLPNWRRAVPGEPIAIAKGLVATPLQVPHDAAEPVAWRIAYGGGAAVVATDLGTLPAGFTRFCAGATHLLLEANYHRRLLAKCDYLPEVKRRIASDEGHMDVELVCDWLRDSMPESIRNVYLGHISLKACNRQIVRGLAAAALHNKPDVRLEVLAR